MDTSKAHWLIENWERTGSNGNPQQMSFKWKLKEAAISIHMPSGFMKSYGVVGLTQKAVKLLASPFGRRGNSDTERSYSQFVHPCTPRPGNETVNDTSSTGGVWARAPADHASHKQAKAANKLQKAIGDFSQAFSKL